MNALKVVLGDVEVGMLEVFSDFVHRFTFADSYVSRPLPERPVLGQIFEDRFPHSIDVDGPVCWFSHLLPQGVMRTWRSRLLDIDEDDDFKLLAELGRDMPGAVTLIPTQSRMSHLEALIESSPTTVEKSSPLKFSLAGAQWKLSARSSGRGLTTRAESEGRAYIAKFDAPEYPELPECELATMRWASASGIAVPACELRRVEDFDEIPDGMPTGNGSVYVIERFDRDDCRRVHIEDFGQILDRPPGNSQYRGSYEEIGQVLSWIAPETSLEFLKQVVFSVVCGNGDAHLKNFSVIYHDGRTAALSPAYDVVSTICYCRPNKEDLALSLGGTKRFAEVTMESFYPLYSALRMDIDLAEREARMVIESARDAWSRPEVREAYSSRHRDRIDQHFSTLQLSDA